MIVSNKIMVPNLELAVVAQTSLDYSMALSCPCMHMHTHAHTREQSVTCTRTCMRAACTHMHMHAHTHTHTRTPFNGVQATMARLLHAAQTHRQVVDRLVRDLTAAGQCLQLARSPHKRVADGMDPVRPVAHIPPYHHDRHHIVLACDPDAALKIWACIWSDASWCSRPGKGFGFN